MSTSEKRAELRMEFLKEMLEDFKRTRSIAKATEICDWLIEKL